MKKLNLLNRCAIVIYRGMQYFLLLTGIISFKYDARAQQFIPLGSLYAIILTVFSALFVVGVPLAFFVNPTLVHTRNHQSQQSNTPPGFHIFGVYVMLKACICFLARFYQCKYEGELVALLNELHDIRQELQICARHPNFFRFSHLVLCLLAVQSLVRSMDDILQGRSWGTTKLNVLVVYAYITLCSAFVIAITIVLMIFVGLIACYDELQRCTKRASNDVRTLRLGHFMENGQRLVLVEQLRCYIVELIAVRGRMFGVTLRLIKYFRLYLLLAIVYWLFYEIVTLMSVGIGKSIQYTLYRVSVGLLNIAFYCTIFEIFVWKTRLSRSFWNFHLLNYNRSFDRTIDELLHSELIENVKVSAYGLRLDKRLFCKILIVSLVYILVHIVYRKKWKHRKEINGY